MGMVTRVSTFPPPTQQCAVAMMEPGCRLI